MNNLTAAGWPCRCQYQHPYIWHIIDATYLALWHKNRNRRVLTRRERKITHALDPQLIPHLGQVIALEELDLVGDDASAEALVGRVLEVPAGLRLLDPAPHDSMGLGGGVGRLLHDLPDLEVLGGVAIGVLGRTLPGDEVGSEGGEAQLEDILGGDGRDDVTDGGVDDGDPTPIRLVRRLLGRGTYFSGEAQAKYRPQGEYALQRRFPSGLNCQSRLATRSGAGLDLPLKPRQRLIHRGRIEDTDPLDGTDCTN